MTGNSSQLIAELRQRLADPKPLSDGWKLRLIRKIEATMEDPLPDADRAALEELRQRIFDRAHAETQALGRGKPRAPI